MSNTVVRTNRQVIEHKLLTALEDESTVAALFTDRDLFDLTEALTVYCCRSRYASTSQHQHVDRCREMLRGLSQLRKEAFGK